MTDPAVSGAPPIPLPLPPSSVAPTPERAERHRRLARRLDGLLALAVLLFAFLVSSFAVRNGDFWQHLASGRLLASGQYRFGEDPFAYTTAGVRWVNHAWLFDLALYGWYQTAGGPSVVVLKALAVAILAGLLLSIRPPGQGLALSAGCTALAVLALSPRALVQPATVSYLFLGLTLWLLWRPYGATHGRWEFGRRVLLLALPVLWVNVDSWFLLGPLLTALFWLGERWGCSARHTPGWLAPAALALCLLNPHHVHAFGLPPEVAPAFWGSELTQVPRFRGLFLSPWQFDRYLQPTVGRSAAGLSYYALTALGVLSFLAGGRGLRDWRLPAWAVFALLATWQVQAIPFFAVVAGPVTALNFHDALARRRSASSAAGLWGRAALLLATLALLVLSWPGWLQAVPQERRRVAWAVTPDPSLERLTRTLRFFRERGLPGLQGPVFALHPDVTNYCAWFCPGEQGYLDHRLTLFDRVAAPYSIVARALESEAEAGGDWLDVLRKQGVGALVLYEGDVVRLYGPLRRVVKLGEGHWGLGQVDGRALVFLPLPAEARDLVEDQAFRLAGPEQVADRGGTRRPRPAEAWERFLRPTPPRPPESDAATLLLRTFEDRAEADRQERLRQSLSAYAASLAGVPALSFSLWEAPVRVLAPMLDAPLFLADLNVRPPALPLLAVRAARRALAVNPDDANAWLRLGQAYLALQGQTGERPPAVTREPPWQPLAILRHVQIVTALENALVLEPDLEPAHRTLAEVYAHRNFLDVALEHARAALRLRRRGPLPGELPEEYRRALEYEEKMVEALEQVVRERTNEYAIQARPLTADPLGRARLAAAQGLGRVALDDVLLQSSVQLFGGNGARLQLELMLMLGRADEVRTRLEDEELTEVRQVLGEAEMPAASMPGYAPSYRLPAYEWLRLYQAAGTGDYATAVSVLNDVRMRFEQEEEQVRLRLHQGLLVGLTSEIGLATPPAPLPARLLARVGREQTSQYLTLPPPTALQRADLATLAGLLTLEQGRPGPARDKFQDALDDARGNDFAGRFLAVRYLQYLEHD